MWSTMNDIRVGIFSQVVWIPVFALCAAMAGCVTPQSSILYNTSQNDVLQDADRYFQQGKYRQASVMYSSFVYTAVTEDDRLNHAQYRLALSHYYMGQYSDSASILRELVARQPDFVHAEQARDLLQRSEQQIAQRQQDIEDNLNSIQREITKYETLIANTPSDTNPTQRASQHLSLGDLYWDSGRFQAAIKEYQTAASYDAVVLESETVRNRVRIDDSGAFTLRNPLLLPATQQDRVYVRDHDLEFIERSNWLGTTEFLRLTGTVHNSGLYDVRNVTVEGSISDFYGTIQGTSTFNIGTLRAGASRPFEMTFRNYTGSGFDIRDYKTTVYYDER